MSRTIQIDMYGKTYYGIMATIDSTMLDFKEHADTWKERELA